MILAHELNEFTMGEAIKYYPKLKEVFKVSFHIVHCLCSLLIYCSQYIVPVGTGMNATRPYVEDGYSMESFAQRTSVSPMSRCADVNMLCVPRRRRGRQTAPQEQHECYHFGYDRSKADRDPSCGDGPAECGHSQREEEQRRAQSSGLQGGRITGGWVNACRGGGASAHLISYQSQIFFLFGEF